MSRHKALIVSLEEYSNPRHNLPGLSVDVGAFNGVLHRFGIRDLETLRDANATKANIQTGLNALVNDASIGDVRIFYFTGHGVQVPAKFGNATGRNEAYVPYEASTDSLIHDLWIEDFLKARLADGVFFYGIYDCCHSGQMYKKFNFSESESTELVKEVDFSSLAFGHELGGLSAASAFNVKSFIEEPELRNSVHIGASEPDTTALVMNIDGTKRSVFTWAFEQVAEKGISLAEFEEKITGVQATRTSHHKPILAAAAENRELSLFNIT